MASHGTPARYRQHLREQGAGNVDCGLCLAAHADNNTAWARRNRDTVNTLRRQYEREKKRKARGLINSQRPEKLEDPMDLALTREEVMSAREML